MGAIIAFALCGGAATTWVLETAETGCVGLGREKGSVMSEDDDVLTRRTAEVDTIDELAIDERIRGGNRMAICRIYGCTFYRRM